MAVLGGMAASNTFHAMLSVTDRALFDRVAGPVPLARGSGPRMREARELSAFLEGVATLFEPTQQSRWIPIPGMDAEVYA